MKTKYTYIQNKIAKGYSCVILLAILLLQSILPLQSIAKNDPVPNFDEILVFLNVQGVGGIQVPAAIVNETAYLSVTDVFDFLRIKNEAVDGLGTVSGFIVNPESAFTINREENTIVYLGKKFDLKPNSLIHTETTLYLNVAYFGEIFGLHCKFNFRNLSVILSTDIELPVMREMRLEAMRNNIMQLKGESKADTVIPHSYDFFRMGMADWSIINTKDISNGKLDTRATLAIGGVVAGGETNIALNYRTGLAFKEREQFYQWRFVDNDNPYLRQVRIGKISTPTVSTIFSPIVGIQITNASATYRKSFGIYTLTYYNEAGWMAELYVNNTLVDYAKAETTGLSTFQVPLVYGSSQVKIKFYSPWGEEKTSEQNILIPFNFLPAKEFEYTFNAGMIEDSLNSGFGRANANYGVNTKLTVGGGVEYISTLVKGDVMPFVNASFRVNSNMMIAGEYVHGVRSKFASTYRMGSDVQVELNYTRYKPGQKAINNTFLEERKMIVSFPFRKKHFTLFSRYSIYQVVLPSSKTASGKVAGLKYTTTEALFSTVVYGINTNLTTYGLFIGKSSPYIYTNLAMTFRLPGRLICTPQIQYEYNRFRLTSVKGEIGRYINTRGYFNAFYENNFKSGFQNFGIGFRYDFSFAIAGLSFTKGSKGKGAMVQFASGSLMYNDGDRTIKAGNRNSVGKGLIAIVPYLDVNSNGKRDMGEPAVAGLNIRMHNGGRIRYNNQDTTIVVSDLEAYADYTFTISESFENIAWHIRNKIVKVTVDPNQFKRIEIPVDIVHEISGTVYLKDGEQRKGLGRIIVSFYRKDYTLAGETITEADGTFSFTGLPPGEYSAQINKLQTEKLKMIAEPWSKNFTITSNKNGDVVDGIEFVLQYKK